MKLWLKKIEMEKKISILRKESTCPVQTSKFGNGNINGDDAANGFATHWSTARCINRDSNSTAALAEAPGLIFYMFYLKQ